MHSLDAIQRWVQAVIMNPEGVRRAVASPEARQVLPFSRVEQIVTPSQSLSGLERLEIYHNAYYARLLECLREEFPVTRHAVGEEAFDQFAFAYLQKYPSRSYTLNQLGASFPRYLAESRPTEEDDPWPDFVIDLATLEQTFNEVFDGPGVEGQRLLDAEALAAVPAERWPEARLVPVPCLRLLALRIPVQRYFAAVRKKQEPPLPRPRKTFLAITRRDYVVRRYQVSRVQHVLLEGLSCGRAIGEVIQRAAEAGKLDPTALRTWFRNWTAEGFFQAIVVQET